MKPFVFALLVMSFRAFGEGGASISTDLSIACRLSEMPLGTSIQTIYDDIIEHKLLMLHEKDMTRNNLAIRWEPDDIDPNYWFVLHGELHDFFISANLDPDDSTHYYTGWFAQVSTTMPHTERATIIRLASERKSTATLTASVDQCIGKTITEVESVLGISVPLRVFPPTFSNPMFWIYYRINDSLLILGANELPKNDHGIHGSRNNFIWNGYYRLVKHTISPDLCTILIDSLRPDHLDCYGYGRETSPFVGSFAAEGTLFEQAMTSVPWTQSSVEPFSFSSTLVATD